MLGSIPDRYMVIPSNAEGVPAPSQAVVVRYKGPYHKVLNLRVPNHKVPNHKVPNHKVPNYKVYIITQNS